jgi:osmoprotectant transport system ATP-binding protein
MDEPFGAVDPQQRHRLQTEFRALQQDLGTTVLFVTHDIDEAVRLADRIAVFGTGYIAQVATPADLLAAPASDEVADFVGSDRGIRRLSVIPLAKSHLTPASGSRPVSEDRVLQLGIPLRDAFLALVASSRSSIAVVDPDDGGKRVGTLTSDGIVSALRDGATPPAEPGP